METTVNKLQTKTHNSMTTVMTSPGFRLLWLGQGTSLLGDQFYLIAMPWLVLQRTGDPLALGAILALAGLPRAIFMLLGGAVTDRFSPRRIMLVSDVIRLSLMAGLTALVLLHATPTWALYAFSLLFGTAAGFFMPASNAIVPALIGKENLPAGNAITQGTGQLAQFIGPVLAGSLIAWAGNSLHLDLDAGMAVAFAFDAFTFLVSVVTLWMINVPSYRSSNPSEKMLTSIGNGLKYFWQDSFIRFVLVMMACGSLFFAGTLLVGVPILVTTRIGSASAYGMLMSAYAGGSLIGVLAAGTLVKPGPLGLKWLLVILNLISAFGWITLIYVSSSTAAALVMLVIGLGGGYQMITFFTALQRRAPHHLLGRLMSLVLLFNIGLTPISQTLAGMISRWNLNGLFAISGLMFLALISWATFQPEFQMVGNILANPKVS
jgi:predicted MFS family arabinose efflux permease